MQTMFKFAQMLIVSLLARIDDLNLDDIANIEIR
jgi:hypothetical protein